MTPIRAIFASVVSAVLLAAGVFIAAQGANARPHDLLPLLSPERASTSLLCFLAAWGAVALGGLGVITAFLAFLAPEDHDELGRRGFPKAAPIIFIVIALGLAYFALRCGETRPIDVAVEPSAPPDAAPAAGASPVPAAPPAIEIAVASYQWRYKDPLVNEAGIVWGGYELPFADDADAPRLLCGKEWVAVTGSASEEGPVWRNAQRARIRAEVAMQRAERWLAGRADCGPTVVLGVDLGQHIPTGPIDDGGAATAYQRQVLVLSRARSADRAAPDQAAAIEELKAFLEDRKNRAALYAGRSFPQEPTILAPGEARASY